MPRVDFTDDEHAAVTAAVRRTLDAGTSVSGRGWVALGTAGRLVGHIFIHKGDDSGFVAERE